MATLSYLWIWNFLQLSANEVKRSKVKVMSRSNMVKKTQVSTSAPVEFHLVCIVYCTFSLSVFLLHCIATNYTETSTHHSDILGMHSSRSLCPCLSNFPTRASMLIDRPDSTAVDVCSRRWIVSRPCLSLTRRPCRRGRLDVSSAAPLHCNQRSAAAPPCGPRSVAAALRRTSGAV